MRLSDYWLADSGWLRKYATARVAFNNGVETSVMSVEDANHYSELQSKRPSILEINDDSATVFLHGPITANGPDLFDLESGEGGLSYSEFNAALLLADEGMSDGETLYIDADTPGGDASGVEESTSIIADIASRRPVVTIVSGMLASAGVWVTSPSTEIIANWKSNVIGSIGVAQQVVDWSGFLNSMGIVIKDLTNTKSRNKRPDMSTEEGEKVVVDLLDEFYGLFIGAVLSGRGSRVTREKIEELNGAVVLSEKALSTGLIDRIAMMGSNKEDSSRIESTTEGIEMKFSEYLAQNPEAKKEYDAQLADARADGVAEERAAAKQRSEAVMPFMKSEAYPQQIKDACVAAAIGERSVEGVKDFIALFEMKNEGTNVNHSNGEAGEAGEAGGETPPADPAKVEAEKSKREIDSRIATVAALI